MKKFTHERFGELLAAREDNENWFSMWCIAKSLKITDGAEKIAWLTDEEKRFFEMPNCRVRMAAFVNEYGFTRLIADIHTKEAIDYQKWILTEVVPELEEEKTEETETQNGLQVFNNPKFGNIRVIMRDGEPWFVGKDVAQALGYADPRKAVRQHVNPQDKVQAEMPPTTNSGLPMVFINESGFYSLVFASKLPTAQDFRYWVTSEVLPSIRKHGAYMTPDTLENFIASPEFGIRLLTELKNEQDRRKEAEKKNAVLTQENTALSNENAIMKPKASYYDIVLQCSSLLTITQIAKDYGMSGTHMNAILCELGVQYKSGKIWLLYQKYAGCGYTQSATAVYTEWDGMLNASTYTKWTQKGRLFIYNLLKDHGILPLIEQESENV